MYVIISSIKINGVGHRTLMVGTAYPSWWEVIFLFRWFRKTVAFVGRGSVWFEHPKLKPVSKLVARQLQKREKHFINL